MTIRRSMFFFNSPSALLVLCAVPAFSQVPSSQQAPPPVQNPPATFKSATHLVQVSIIAQDGKGQPVADLKKEDFRVRVNGKDQPVKVFSMDSNLARPGSVPAKHDQLPPNVFLNRTEATTTQKSNITIILLDTLNTSGNDLVSAKAQVIRYLRTLHPSDHVGLYVLGGSLLVLHNYTADASKLLSGLEALQAKELPNTARKEAPDALMFDDLQSSSRVPDAPEHGTHNENRSAGSRAPERSPYADNRITGTLRAIEFIANHLAKTPGRKNLVWVSSGFPLIAGIATMEGIVMKGGVLYLIHDKANPEDIRNYSVEANETVRALNDANMAIYPVDARRLVGPDPLAEMEGEPPLVEDPRVPAFETGNKQSMYDLASRTGGRAYVNTNGLTQAIHDAIDDSRVTYTLGFYPVDENYDGKFHNIEVNLVGRKGVHLRYRKGFYDLLQFPQDEKTRKRELRDAAWSPLDATGIEFAAKVVMSKSKPGALDIVLAIDTTQISLDKQSENWVGRLDVLFVQGDEDGNQYNSFDDTINLRLGSATYAKFLKEGFVYNRLVDRTDRAQHLRIVVRDAATGAIGSITVPLENIF